MARDHAPSGTRPSEDDRREADRIEEQGTPRTPVIYEAVRRIGEQEMARPAASLAWSGLAAGLSLSFSLLAQAILRMHLPEAPWRELVTALGYPVGFVMVVLGRQQLFTENTITVVLPVMAQPTRAQFARGLRMWGIVLAANMAGTLFAALFCVFTPVLRPELLDSMLAISRQLLDLGWMESGLHGVTAGFLMATMVWLLPAAGNSQLGTVLLITYLIGVGHFTHVIAGSMEVFLLMAHGEPGAATLLWRFLPPALAGNIVGGTVLFALISYAQVMKETGGRPGR